METSLNDAICSFQDIAVGVASANVASGVLSFVPVVGVFFAVGCAIVGLSTSNEIGNRLEARNKVLDQGSDPARFFFQMLSASKST